VVKLSVAVSAALLASASAFAPAKVAPSKTALAAVPAGEYWDPLSLAKLGTGESFDTFPGMFPNWQYLEESEIKHGRMCMLAWTGVWATHQGGLGLGLHFPGFPVEPDWTKALGVFAAQEPIWFGVILALICIAEGESVGHAGDNWRGKSKKTTPGDLNFDYLGLGKTLSADRKAHYAKSEVVNGRAAMIAMASLFSFETIPGSVPLMDLLGAQ
jgi:light-harvesting complex I chlorophyll a/b binding protein 1